MPLTKSTLTDLRSALAAIVEPETRRASSDGWALRAMAQARAAETELATQAAAHVAELAATKEALAQAQVELRTARALAADVGELCARLEAADRFVSAVLALVGADSRESALGAIEGYKTWRELALNGPEPEETSNILPFPTH